METPYLRRLGMGAFPRPTTVLTSKPYAVVAPVEGMSSSFMSTEGGFIPNEDYSYLEGMDASVTNVSGEIRTTFKEYTEWEPESLAASVTATEGDIRQVLKSYDEWDVEEINSSFVSVTGDIAQILITYDNYETETLEAAVVSVSGDLV